MDTLAIAHEQMTNTRADGMVRVPSGDFLMGSDDGSAVEKPIHRVDLDEFFIDATPVTNAAFAAFVAKTGYRTTAERLERIVEREEGLGHLPRPADAELSWRSFATPERQDHPVVVVSWGDADAYAKWVGKRLPTEAEWEKAARGGLLGKRFPWGDQAPVDRANWNRVGAENAAPPTTAVRTFEPNRYGVYDMAGNVWEWCGDWYADPYYVVAPEANPQGPSTGQYRVRRGASWNVREDFRLRCANRGAMLPDRFWPNLGFRCAVSSADLA